MKCSYLRMSTHVMELPGAELEDFQQALDILLKKAKHHTESPGEVGQHFDIFTSSKPGQR